MREEIFIFLLVIVWHSLFHWIRLAELIVLKSEYVVLLKEIKINLHQNALH